MIAARIGTHDEQAAREKRRIDKRVLILALLTVVATLGLTVNPWPRDGWYQTQYVLFGSFPGHDNYTPIAAPALLYRMAHAIAALAGFGLAEEFYVASVLQNLLLLLSACFIYYTLKLMHMRRLAGPVAVGFLLLVLSTGLPQAFWSENAALFLMSAVVLVLAVVLYGTRQSQTKFWSLALLCGLLVGLLVITRMTPIFLIPGIALLFFRRMPARLVAQFAGTLTLVTLLMIAVTVVGNHARFGRYELTNSSGRHLWQGVKEFTDRTLADSAEYQALKKLDPHIQGKNPGQMPGADFTGADPRDPLFRKLATQAILNAPALYLIHGAEKFVRTIGRIPYRLGYGAPRPGINPLNRADFLPPLSSLMNVPAAFSVTVDAVFRSIYSVGGWLYPISIFAIAVSALAMIVEHLDRLLKRRASHRATRKRILPVAVFFTVGILLAAIPVATSGIKLQAVIGSVLCALLLGYCASVLYRTLDEKSASARSHAGISFFSFLALIFFGSLWFSWQVEVADSRNTLPYLPLWAVMLAIVVTYWRDVWSYLHSRAPDSNGTRPDAV